MTSTQRAPITRRSLATAVIQAVFVIDKSPGGPDALGELSAFDQLIRARNELRQKPRENWLQLDARAAAP